MGNKAVAIVGMCGTGKSVVGKVFLEKGWKLTYFGGVVINEVKARGLEVTPQNEKIVREDLRRQFGPAAMAKKLVPTIKEQLKECNTALDGLYSWSEYKYLKQELGDDLVLVAIVTDKAKRYANLANRPERGLTAEEAYARDVAEIENIEKGGPIAIADYFIKNDGSEEELQQKIKDLFNL